MEKIGYLFLDDVAAMIQEIPLGKSKADDVLVWDNEDNGCYNVRSGYWLLTGYYEEEGHVPNRAIADQRDKVI